MRISDGSSVVCSSDLAARTRSSLAWAASSEFWLTSASTVAYGPGRVNRLVNPAVSISVWYPATGDVTRGSDHTAAQVTSVTSSAAPRDGKECVATDRSRYSPYP